MIAKTTAREPRMRFSRRVRVPAAVAMLLLLLALTTVDRVACPDGCTDEASHSELSGPRNCGLCQGWSGGAALLLVEPSARITPPWQGTY